MCKLTIKKVYKYDLLSLVPYIILRWKVFATEQNRGICGEFYLEDLTAEHYSLSWGTEVIGIARVIDRGYTLELGRIAIKKSYRSQGYGQKLVNLLISEIESPNSTRSLSLFTNRELVTFYQKLGFVEQEEVYFDESPIIKMVKRKNDMKLV